MYLLVKENYKIYGIKLMSDNQLDILNMSKIKIYKEFGENIK